MDEKTPTNVSDDHVQIMVVSEEMQQPNDNNPPVTRDINSKVSSLFTQGWSFLKDKAKEASEKAKVAIEKSKVIVNNVSNEIQKTIDDEFKSDKDKAVQDQLNLYFAPWEELGVDENIAKEIEMQILSISKNERHFINGPKITQKLLLGENIVFNFNFDEWIGTAKAAIKKDKDLEKLRYKLVPRKMSEYDFWRTYFYKVGIIKVAYNLDFSPRKRIIENQPQENINNEPKPVESTTPQVKKSNLIIEDSDEDDLNNQGENKKDETNEFVSEYFDNDINKDWNTEFQQELNELGISDEKLDQEIEDDNLDEELRKAIEM